MKPQTIGHGEKVNSRRKVSRVSYDGWKKSLMACTFQNTNFILIQLIPLFLWINQHIQYLHCFSTSILFNYSLELSQLSQWTCST